ncbi:MAG: hypothetical protein ACTSRS_11900 [Candidatus Helarchaeota archaeon]
MENKHNLHDIKEFWQDLRVVLRAFCHECPIPRKDCGDCWIFDIRKKWNIIDDLMTKFGGQTELKQKEKVLRFYSK